MLSQAVLVIGGLWLMYAPAALGYDGVPATSDRVAGPVMAAVAFLAAFEITRGLRWLNVPVGLWLGVAPWLLDFPVTARVSSVAIGVMALTLSWPEPADQTRYGGGWRALFDVDRLPPDT